MNEPSLYFNEDHELFRQSAREFVRKEVQPHIDEWEEKGEIPRYIWQKMGEAGFLGLSYPEQYGGNNLDFFYSVVWLEELARANAAGFCAAVSVHQYMSVAHIAEAGSEYLKQKYLTGAINGTSIGALGISEPGAGGDVAAIKTTAVREGDEYVINGSKIFITNGYYCDFVTLACRTNPDPASGIGGISLIVVDKKLPGFSCSKLKKMGWHSSDTAEMFFDNVRVPAQNLLGEEGRGFYYIMDSFQLERLVAGISSIAGAEYGLQFTLKYLNERKAFGRPIAKFQALRHDIVNIATEIEAAKQLTYHAAWKFDKGVFAVKDCSMVKLLTSEVTKKASDIFLQCFGGYGFMEDYPAARMYRDVRVGTIVGGTSQIMREILAKIIIDDVQYKSAYKQQLNTDAAPPHIQTSPNDNENNNNNENNLHQNPTVPMTPNPTTARDIVLSLPDRFKAYKVKPDYETCMHFNISGDNGGEFTVTVKDSHCEVNQGLIGQPKCTVSTKDRTYEGIELGKENPQMAVMMGKIKISNLAEMMTFISLFQRLY